eukprot:SAG31_NODE_7847_length_1583_cov_1.880054_2_plen_133_part_00
MGLDWIGIELYEGGEVPQYFLSKFRGKAISYNTYLFNDNTAEVCYGSDVREGNEEVPDRPTNGRFLSELDKVTIVKNIKTHIEKCKKPRSRTPSKKYLETEWEDTKEDYIEFLENAIDFLENEEFEDIYCWF